MCSSDLGPRQLPVDVQGQAVGGQGRLGTPGTRHGQADAVQAVGLVLLGALYLPVEAQGVLVGEAGLLVPLRAAQGVDGVIPAVSLVPLRVTYLAVQLQGLVGSTANVSATRGSPAALARRSSSA